MISRTIGRLALVVACGCAAAVAAADTAARLKMDKLSSRIQWLEQPGMGNVTVFVAEDGLLIVDSGTPQSAAAVAERIAALSPRPVRYVVNTHYHDDHTGGNAAVAGGATVIAAEGCRKTMIAKRDAEAEKGDARLPQETYGSERGLRVGKHMVRLVHFGPAHTSGDTVVVFESEKVVAAGDLFFHGLPPYIDVADGCDTDNWVKAIRAVAARYPKYKVVPGHGPVTDMKAWLRFADYLSALRERVKAAIDAGQTREQAVASIRLDEFPEIEDAGEFLTKARNVGWVYDELTRR